VGGMTGMNAWGGCAFEMGGKIGRLGWRTVAWSRRETSCW